MTDLSVAAIGFSLAAALLLAVAHLWSPACAGLSRARWLGSALLLNLALIQTLHFLALRHGLQLWDSGLYSSQMFATAPLFYFFCRAVLNPERTESRWVWLLGAPAVLGLFISGRFVFFAAYFIGALYFVKLTVELFGLRAQRSRFAVEMGALLLILVIAAMTLMLGGLMFWLQDAVFFATYSVLVALAFLPALYLVIRYPDIVSIVNEASALTRASTLGSVSVDTKLDLLERLMRSDKFYVNPDLSLSLLASALELSNHQTSELLNQRLGVGFSQYVRQLRVDEARRQLLDQPQASVLSIALSVGFSSQSTFYAAFREQQGVTPAKYREQALRTPK